MKYIEIFVAIAMTGCSKESNSRSESGKSKNFIFTGRTEESVINKFPAIYKTILESDKMIKPLKSVISVPGPLDSDFYFDNLSEFLGSWNSKKSCCSLRVERKAASANTLVYHVILIRKDPSNS